MSDWLDIAGKVVIVTGGSSGIGRSIVENLLKQNAQVANFDVTECRIQHENLLSLKVDVSSKTDIEEGIYKVMKHFKTIDGLVNNAGINIPSLLIDRNHPKSKYELSEQVFDKMIAVNQKSVYLMSQAVGRILVQKGRTELLCCYKSSDEQFYSFLGKRVRKEECSCGRCCTRDTGRNRFENTRI